MMRWKTDSAASPKAISFFNIKKVHQGGIIMNTMNTMNPTYYPEGMFPKSLRADEMTREQLTS